MVRIIQKVKHVIVPSRELRYPTLGKGKSSSKCHFFGGYVSSLEGMFSFCGFFFWRYFTKCFQLRRPLVFQKLLLLQDLKESSENPENHQQFRSLILTKTSQQKTLRSVRDCILGWWTKQLEKNMVIMRV